VLYRTLGLILPPPRWVGLPAAPRPAALPRDSRCPSLQDPPGCHLQGADGDRAPANQASRAPRPGGALPHHQRECHPPVPSLGHCSVPSGSHRCLREPERGQQLGELGRSPGRSPWAGHPPGAAMGQVGTRWPIRLSCRARPTRSASPGTTRGR